MSKVPAVAILVLTYNHENFILDCLRTLDSMINPQTHFYILDDGSTDNTAKIVSDFTTGRSNYTFISQQNTANVALNTKRLFDESAGEFVIFLSADDYLQSYYPVSELIEKFEKDPTLGLIIPNCRSANKPEDTASLVSKKLQKILYSGNPGKVINKHLYRKVSRIFMQGIFLRRQTVKDFGFSTSETADDYEFIFNLFLHLRQKELRFEFLEDIYWFYRIHEKNLHRVSARQFSMMINTVVQFVPVGKRLFFRWDLNAFLRPDELSQALQAAERKLDKFSYVSLGLQTGLATFYAALIRKDKLFAQNLMKLRGTPWFLTPAAWILNRLLGKPVKK
jgi:glycosyltransferase involved in cell wall biosynthesis